MDEFHISTEQFAELNKSIEQFVEAVNQTKNIVMAYCNTFFGTLEPYQIYEMRHPKKKPRGSIRRNKRNEREKNRNSINSNLYIDDIYGLPSKDN